MRNATCLSPVTAEKRRAAKPAKRQPATGPVFTFEIDPEAEPVDAEYLDELVADLLITLADTRRERAKLAAAELPAGGGR